MIRAVLKMSDGRLEEMEVNALLLTTGREPNVENLGLEEVGIEYD